MIRPQKTIINYSSSLSSLAVFPAAVMLQPAGLTVCPEKSSRCVIMVLICFVLLVFVIRLVLLVIFIHLVLHV